MVEGQRLFITAQRHQYKLAKEVLVLSHENGICKIEN